MKKTKMNELASSFEPLASRDHESLEASSTLAARTSTLPYVFFGAGPIAAMALTEM